METDTRSAMTDVLNEPQTERVEEPVKVDMKSPSGRKRKVEDTEDAKENTEGGQVNEGTNKRQKTSKPAELSFTAPVQWSADAGSDGSALYVDKDQCIMGTTDGRVIYLNHEGRCLNQFCLQEPVSAIFKYGDRMYAWCHARQSYQKWKGALIDITQSPPQAVFDLHDFGDIVCHVAMVDECLAVGDDHGNVALLGCDGDVIWQKKQADGDGGFFAADASGIYFAHKRVVRCYSLQDGEVTWQYDVTGGRYAAIQGGCQDEAHIYVAADRVLQLDRATGQLVQDFTPYRHRAAGVAVGNGLLVTGTCPTVLFDLSTGEEIYRMNFAGKLADSVSVFLPTGKFFSFWDKLYCVNLTPEGVGRAAEGRSTRMFELKVPQPSEQTILRTLEPQPLVTTEYSDGIQVTCSEVNGKVKAKVNASGYNENWNVMLPVGFNEPGVTYVVQSLVESKLGSFYRAVGRIECLKLAVASIGDLNENENVDENVNENVDTTNEEVNQKVNDVTDAPSGDEAKTMTESESESGSRSSSVATSVGDEEDL